MVDMEMFKAYLNEVNGFNHHNRIRFTVVEEGYCECRVDLTKESLNPQGVAHGSLLFALCDCVTGVAAASHDRGMLTQCASIQYIRPGTGKTLTARSQLVHNGRQTALCNAEVLDEKGRLVVTGQFEIFYTSDHLTLPERDEEGNWHNVPGRSTWSV